MAFTPTDIANRALDAIGVPEMALGDIQDGSQQAQILLRSYGECRDQLLRGAHWQFARAQAPMVLLADATGQTPNVGTIVPAVQFIYEYEWPIDCLKLIYVPWYQGQVGSVVPPGNIQLPPNVPQVTGLGQAPPAGTRPRPTPYLVMTDQNYPPPAGTINWEVEGISPQGRKVILTNVKQAQLVYTRKLVYPSTWDALFRSAMVAYLASEVALAIWAKKGNPKFGLELRGQQIAIVKGKLDQARIADGNDMWAKNDIPVDWMQVRNTGGGWFGPGWAGGYGGGFGGGAFWGGWDQCSFGDGSVY